MSKAPYNPFAWPPNIAEAELHYNCNKAGMDKPGGLTCPCCNRKEKEVTNWFWRDIGEDFKNFGGGIPAYFDLLKYLMIVLIIPCLLKVIYHMVIVSQICPGLADTQNRCALIFGGYYVCSHQIMFDTLNNTGRPDQANALVALQLTTYLIMVASTLGVKVFLHLRFKQANPNEKLFSNFAIAIKNVPLYYKVDDLIAQLKSIDSSIQIRECFYLHRTAKAEKCLKALTDLTFSMRNKQMELNLLRGRQSKKAFQAQQKYNKMKEKYLNLYDDYEKEELFLETNSKKVIVVFNTIQQKEIIHSALQVNNFSKLIHYSSKLLCSREDNLPFYSQRISEPQEIHWKFKGESSTHKLKVSFQTILIGASFIVIMFIILYFPMISIDVVKANNASTGAILGVLNSAIITGLMLLFRYIISLIMPLFQPSSKIIEGQYTVITISIFFFAFYIVSPVCFYLFDHDFSDNLKLGSFFTTILIFCCFTIGVGILDLGYRTFAYDKNKVLNSQKEANTYCQSRLHELVTSPNFPVAFKMVVAFNMWSFNSYYIFNLPMLLLVFLVVLFILYWVDKYVLYNHYKHNNYISLELLQKSQRVILFLFVLCVSAGYLTIAQYVWQQVLVGVVGLLMLISHLLIQKWLQVKEDKKIDLKTDLQTAVDKVMEDEASANILGLREKEMSSHFIFADLSSRKSRLTQFKPVQGNAAVFSYQETYNLYLNQFQNPVLQKIIEDQLKSISKVTLAKEMEMFEHKSQAGGLRSSMLHRSMQRRSFMHPGMFLKVPNYNQQQRYLHDQFQKMKKLDQTRPNPPMGEENAEGKPQQSH